MNARLIKDINPDFRGSNVSNTTNVEGVFYFTAFDGEEYGLWTSDGTSLGTNTLASFEQLPASNSEYVPVEDRLFFTNLEEETGVELWVSDGTEEGTRVVTDLFDEGSSNPQQLTAVDEAVYFLADGDGDLELELWTSDGTEGGTELVLDNEVANLTDVDGTLYFTQGGPGEELTQELWRLNEEGEAEIVLEDSGSDEIGSLTSVDGTLYFVRNGYELWQVDPESGEAEEIEEFDRGDDSEAIADLTEVGDTLFFTFNDGETNRELYKSDGAASNTGLVRDISPDMRDAGTTINLSSEPSQFIDVEGTLYFTADSNDDNEQELWKSDGTEDGTELVIQFDRETTPQFSGNIFQPTNVGGTVYFLVGNRFGDGQVWRSDGTEAGTELATEITADNFIASAEAVNGDLYYISNEAPSNRSSTGSELWILENTTGVTRLFDPDTRANIYTIRESEIDTLVEDGYENRGVALNGADPLSGQPVYEFTDEETGASLYTIDEAERDEYDDLSGFDAEGIAFYAFESQAEGTVPIYRFQNIATDGHFLTDSIATRESLDDSDRFESNGIAFYAFPEIDLAVESQVGLSNS